MAASFVSVVRRCLQRVQHVLNKISVRSALQINYREARTDCIFTTFLGESRCLLPSLPRRDRLYVLRFPRSKNSRARSITEGCQPVLSAGKIARQ